MKTIKVATKTNLNEPSSARNKHSRYEQEPMPDLTITDPTDCYACGYDLRGLRESGKCPECGLHIKFTLESRYSERLIERDNALIDKEDERFEQQTTDFDRQTAITKRQQDDADAINIKMMEQAKHFDRILDKWDAVLEKFERMIERMGKNS